MNKQQQLHTTRQAILDAANRVLTVKGAEGFTLEAVAAEASVSKGGLLYHFPSKNSLIQGMIARSIARVDAALDEELQKAGGDYLTAYINASFRTAVEPEPVSRAMIAAMAGDPALIEPLRARFFRMQEEIAAAAPTPALGTMIRLCLDGLWFSDLFDYAPPPLELREKLHQALLALVPQKDAQNS
jgi:AcrR family transcriptional regulator